MNKAYINKKSNKLLKEIYIDKEIMRCEMCGTTFGLSWHHRHKRDFYIRSIELLSTFNQTLLLCIPCHQKVENKKKLSEEIFNKLRGEEI